MAKIELINYINAPAVKIYEALSSSDGLAATWTKKNKVENHVGGIHEFGFGDEPVTKFKVAALEPTKKIAWQCIASDPEWVGTTVSFELKEHAGKTMVLLEHAGWREVTEFYRWCNYNWAFFLYSLKQYMEEGSGIPFQDRRF